jgi:hypothetical protein
MNTEQTEKSLGKLAFQTYWGDTAENDAWDQAPESTRSNWTQAASAIATEVLKRLPGEWVLVTEGNILPADEWATIKNGDLVWSLVPLPSTGFGVSGKIAVRRRIVPEQQTQLGSPKDLRMAQGESPPAVTDARPRCNSCHCYMTPGKAIPEAVVDMGEGQYSVGAYVGNAPLVDVWKCPECGHSFKDDWSPAPRAEWKPRFAVGDRVRGLHVYGEGTVTEVRPTREYVCRCDTGSLTTIHEDRLLPAPWKLPEPPENTRPLEKDEEVQGGDFWFDPEDPDWKSWIQLVKSGELKKTQNEGCLYRRPLPAPSTAQTEEDGFWKDKATYLSGARDKLIQERDAALARCETLRELADRSAAEQGQSVFLLSEAQKKRDEALALASEAEKEKRIESGILEDKLRLERIHHEALEAELATARASVPVWVPCQSRMPTEADADDKFNVLWRRQSTGECISRHWRISFEAADLGQWTHWQKLSPLPPLPVETEEGEEAFEKFWRSPQNGCPKTMLDVSKEAGRYIWQAALRSKKPPLGSP